MGRQISNNADSVTENAEHVEVEKFQNTEVAYGTTKDTP